MIRKDFLSLLAIMLVIICSGLNLTTANAAYPILKLDMGPSTAADQTQNGFIAFTISDSGSEIDGITVEISGDLSARRRGAPAGVPFEQIYRDMIFARPPSGITIELSGLVPDQNYEITIYTWDSTNPDMQMVTGRPMENIFLQPRLMAE